MIKISRENGKHVRQALLDRFGYPKTPKLIGFDTVAKSAAPAPPVQQPKTKRKKAGVGALPLPAPPRHPGVWLGVALVLALSGWGWLLGERRPTSAQPAA